VRRKGFLLGLLTILTLIATAARSQEVNAPSPRPALSAGFGVSYVSAPDVVALINATVSPSERVAQFNAMGEFFGAFSFPLSDLWVVKLEYAYIAGSYSAASGFGPADFGFGVHMPSLLLHYVLAERGVYSFTVGAGGGLSVGTLSEKYVTIDDRFSGSGASMLAELEANTALGDHLFANLSGNVRWSFIGAITNSAGVKPGRAAGGSGTTLGFFGAAARLGLSYRF